MAFTEKTRRYLSRRWSGLRLNAYKEAVERDMASVDIGESLSVAKPTPSAPIKAEPTPPLFRPQAVAPEKIKCGCGELCVGYDADNDKWICIRCEPEWFA